MITVFRFRLPALLCIALLFVFHGCEPLDSDTAGDASQEPSLEETQGGDDTALADSSMRSGKQSATAARLDTLESMMRDTRDQIGRIREDLDAMRSSQPAGETPPSDPPMAYKTSLEQFFNHQYEESAAGFRKIIDDGRPADLQSNSQYWIGECEYGMRQYQAAIKSFGKVFSYPSSTKADDAQMMIGMSYLRLNNKARAKKELKKLIQQYPESEFVPRAKKILTAI